MQDCLKDVSDDSTFLYVEVGGRDEWKDQNCVFRRETTLIVGQMRTFVLNMAGTLIRPGGGVGVKV